MTPARHVAPGHTAAERFMETRLTHREAILIAALEHDLHDSRWTDAGRRSFYRRCWCAGDALSRTLAQTMSAYHR